MTFNDSQFQKLFFETNRNVMRNNCYINKKTLSY